MWMTDERFFTPMIVCNVGHIFVNDFVICVNKGLVKVKRFFKKVDLFIITISLKCILAF